jgi:hypothetical protein
VEKSVTLWRDSKLPDCLKTEALAKVNSKAFRNSIERNSNLIKQESLISAISIQSKIEHKLNGELFVFPSAADQMNFLGNMPTHVFN